ncbi:hypothetical protein GGF43_002834, partial [Coemansia sp. RSA 2618]
MVTHSQGRTPVKTRAMSNPSTKEELLPSFASSEAKSSTSTPRKSRSSKSGTVHAYGTSEQERNAEEEKYAKFLAEKYTHRDVVRVVRFADPLTQDGVDAVAQATTRISAAMEAMLKDGRLPEGSKLPRGLLKSHAGNVSKWTRVGPSMPAEKPLYGYFSSFALFVAHCLQSMADTDGLDMERLVLPAERSDYKPDDSNDLRRIDVGLVARDAGALVKRVPVDSYAGMLCLLEAKWARNLDKNALTQLYMYSANLYMRQPDRRFLWGVTVCADEAYASVMLNDSILVSPAMRISKSDGREQLISLLVRWSMCPKDRLGYDPTMRRFSGDRGSYGDSSSGDGMVDDIAYEIDCYDDETEETCTYVTRRTIMSADDLLGRHTRCFVATRLSEDAKDMDGEEVIIKDAWPPAESPPLEDPRSEIRLLRRIHDEFKDDTPDHIYPNMVVGGHVRLGRIDDNDLDTTDAIIEPTGFLRTELAHGVELGDDWTQQPLRAHRRIVMEPIGHNIKLVRSEAELIVVLVEAMRCHSAVLERCNILHRDISTNNILVVRDGKSTYPRGLLIDFDFAIEVGATKQSARPAQSGTKPYMSIANLLNLDTPRTELDDWESLLYVVCWLATVGINSKDRQYKLLPRFAAALRKALFDNANCPGASFIPVDSDSESDEDPLVEKGVNEEDPLVKRKDHVKAIVNDLRGVLDKYEKKAKDVLDSEMA